MAAKIRLKRVGRKGQPSYRVVVLDGRKARDARVVAELGTYDPKTNPATYTVDGEAALKWLMDGAKATKAARDILSLAGVMAAYDAAKRGVEAPVIEGKEAKKTPEKVVEAKTEEAPAEEAPAEEPAAEEATEEAPAEEEEEKSE